MLIAFMSIKTGARREAYAKGMTIVKIEEKTRAIGNAGVMEIREMLDFPDDIIVYSDGRVEKVGE